jgi:hypothetical protein
VIQQSFCSARDLEEIGIASNAIQEIPLAQRRRAIKSASGVLAPYLRKRQGLPLIPRIDDEEFDTSGMTGGALVTHDNGPAVHARDVLVTFTTSGVVGVAGIMYTLTLDAGAFGAVPSVAQALPLTGILALDGYTFTLSGTITEDDSFSYSARVDSGAATAVAQVAAYLLLGARGIDPKTLEVLKAQADQATKWAKDISVGEGDLDEDADTTPQVAEAGPRFTGQRTPWQFLGLGSGNRGGADF